MCPKYYKNTRYVTLLIYKEFLYPHNNAIRLFVVDIYINMHLDTKNHFALLLISLYYIRDHMHATEMHTNNLIVQKLKGDEALFRDLVKNLERQSSHLTGITQQNDF